MTSQLDKGISSIQYNYLNLPKQINQNSVLTNYSYKADGTKLKKLFGDLETNYLDGFPYKSTKPYETSTDRLVIYDPNEVVVIKLRIIPTSEGYYDFIKNKYIYNYLDHLGNIRLSYLKNDNNNTEIIEENNYYPFGLKHEDYNYLMGGNGSYNYKYQGQELQETGFYSFKWRNYMPDVARFFNVDPLAEKMPSWSPYSYAFDNPIRYTDPDGREPVDDHFNQFGKYHYTDNKKTNNIVIDFQNPITGSLNTAPWLSTQLKDYKFDKNNMQTLMNIANHYAKEAGVDLGNLRGGSVSVAMWNNKTYSGGTADRKSGEYKTFNGGEYCYSCLLQTNKIEKIIRQHEGGATVPSHLNVNMNPYDSSTKGQSKEHYKIYDYQINKSPIFKKTTKDFQDQMNKTFRAVKNGATGNGGN